jgi:2'-hydroxyisoflavone reductase
VLCPPRPEQPIQIIDVRDLARFMLGAIESSLVGTFDVAGPELSFAEMLNACSEGAGFQPVWASEQFLEEQGIALWQDLPLSLEPNGESDALMQVKSASARHAGLVTRPVSETASDTRAWSSEHPAESPSHGLSRERERAALDASKQNELDSATRLI